jgi:hypothetical protein
MAICLWAEGKSGSRAARINLSVLKFIQHLSRQGLEYAPTANNQPPLYRRRASGRLAFLYREYQ